MPRSLVYIILGLILILVANVFKPVPIVSEEEALVETGIIEDIIETGKKDITFVLQDNSKKYYINRGLEKGLEIALLREELIGTEVVFKYPEYKNILTLINKNRPIHISKVQFGDQIIFNELKE